MLKTAAIVAIVAVVAIVAFIYLRPNSETADFEMAKIEVSPKIDLREQASSLVSDISSEEEQLLQDIIPPSPVPEQIEPTTTPISDKRSDQEKLRAKTADWKYRSFIHIGNNKSAIVEDTSTSDMIRVTEGFILKEVKFDKLTRESCSVSLGEATMALPLEAKVVVKADSGPPSYEEQKERFKKYKENVMPTFQHLYSQYTPQPGQVIRTTPPSEEEIETAVAAYYATMQPTIAASTKSPGYSGENFPPVVTPDMPQGADKPPSEEQIRDFVGQQLQEVPAPAPNEVPDEW